MMSAAVFATEETLLDAYVRTDGGWKLLDHVGRDHRLGGAELICGQPPCAAAGDRTRASRRERLQPAGHEGGDRPGQGVAAARPRQRRRRAAVDRDPLAVG